MAEYREKLNFFTTAVLTEAARETEALLQEAEGARARALQQAEDDALRESFDLIRREAARIRTEAARRVSEHRQDCKRAFALRQNQLTDAVFARVSERIAAYTGTSDYRACLAALFAAADSALPAGGETTLFLREEDLPLAKDIVGGRGGVTVCPAAFRLGGLIAERGGARADASFDTALGDQYEQFPALYGKTGEVE